MLNASASLEHVDKKAAVWVSKHIYIYDYLLMQNLSMAISRIARINAIVANYDVSKCFDRIPNVSIEFFFLAWRAGAPPRMVLSGPSGRGCIVVVIIIAIVIGINTSASSGFWYLIIR